MCVRRMIIILIIIIIIIINFFFFFFFDGQKRTVMDTNFFNEYKQIRYIVLNV